MQAITLFNLSSSLFCFIFPGKADEFWTPLIKFVLLISPSCFLKSDREIFLWGNFKKSDKYGSFA